MEPLNTFDLSPVGWALFLYTAAGVSVLCALWLWFAWRDRLSRPALSARPALSVTRQDASHGPRENIP